MYYLTLFFSLLMTQKASAQEQPNVPSFASQYSQVSLNLNEDLQHNIKVETSHESDYVGSISHFLTAGFGFFPVQTTTIYDDQVVDTSVSVNTCWYAAFDSLNLNEGEGISFGIRLGAIYMETTNYEEYGGSSKTPVVTALAGVGAGLTHWFSKSALTYILHLNGGLGASGFKVAPSISLRYDHEKIAVSLAAYVEGSYPGLILSVHK